MQWIGGAESLDAIADGGWHPNQQEFTASQKQSSEVHGGSFNGGGEQQALGILAVGHALVTDKSMDFSAIDDDDHEKAAGEDAEKQAQTQTQTLQSLESNDSIETRERADAGTAMPLLVKKHVVHEKAKQAPLLKYRCPECAEPFQKWSTCLEHLNATGHANPCHKKGLQQRCMSGSVHVKDNGHPNSGCLRGKGEGGREEGIVPEANKHRHKHKRCNQGGGRRVLCPKQKAKSAGKAAQTAAKVAAIRAGEPGMRGARAGGASREPQIRSIDEASAVCPVCKKQFLCAKTMTYHLRDKKDAQHTHFRESDSNTLPLATTKRVYTLQVLPSHVVRPSVVLEPTTQAAALNERASDSSTAGHSRVSKRKKLSPSDILGQPSGSGAQHESNASGARDESNKVDVVTITASC